MNTPESTTDPAPSATHPVACESGRARPSRVWLWVIAVIALQLVAWGVWLVIASQHRVAEVPLATRSAR